MVLQKPKFRLGDNVYLADSARIGRVESLRIGAILNKGDGYVYQIFIDAKPPAEPTVGDRNDLKSSRDLFYGEDELLTACEAIVTAIGNLTVRLNSMENLRDAVCNASEPGDTPAQEFSRNTTNPTRPRFDIEQMVYYKSSAKLGFIHEDSVTNIHWRPDLNEWIYELDIRGDLRELRVLGNILREGPRAFVSLSKKIDTKNQEKRLYFRERELLTQCEALDIAVKPLERQLMKLLDDFVRVCDSE